MRGLHFKGCCLRFVTNNNQTYFLVLHKKTPTTGKTSVSGFARDHTRYMTSFYRYFMTMVMLLTHLLSTPLTHPLAHHSRTRSRTHSRTRSRTHELTNSLTKASRTHSLDPARPLRLFLLSRAQCVCVMKVPQAFPVQVLGVPLI